MPRLGEETPAETLRTGEMDEAKGEEARAALSRRDVPLSEGPSSKPVNLDPQMLGVVVMGDMTQQESHLNRPVMGGFPEAPLAQRDQMLSFQGLASDLSTVGTVVGQGPQSIRGEAGINTNKRLRLSNTPLRLNIC